MSIYLYYTANSAMHLISEDNSVECVLIYIFYGVTFNVKSDYWQEINHT